MKTVLAIVLSLLAFPAFGAVAISLNSVIDAVIWLIIAGLVYWLVLWILGQVGIPEPFNKIARVLAAIVVFIIVLNVLLGFAGHPIFVTG